MKCFRSNFDVSVWKKNHNNNKPIYQCWLRKPARSNFLNSPRLFFQFGFYVNIKWTRKLTFGNNRKYKKQPAVFFNFWHGQVRENRSTSQETERLNIIAPPPPLPLPLHTYVGNISQPWVAASILVLSFQQITFKLCGFTNLEALFSVASTDFSEH